MMPDQVKLLNDLSSVMKQKRLGNIYFNWAVLFGLIFVISMMVPFSPRLYIPSEYLPYIDIIVKSEEFFVYNIRGVLVGAGCLLLYMSKFASDGTVGRKFLDHGRLLGLEKLGIYPKLDLKDQDGSTGTGWNDENEESNRPLLSRSSPLNRNRLERSRMGGTARDSSSSSGSTIMTAADGSGSTLAGGRVSHGHALSTVAPSEAGFTNRSRYGGDRGAAHTSPSKFGFGSSLNRDYSVVDGGPRSQISYNSNVNKSTKWSHYDHRFVADDGPSIYYDRMDNRVSSSRVMMMNNASINRGAFDVTSPDRSIASAQNNSMVNRDMSDIRCGSWQNSPIDNSQILAAEGASKKNFNALTMLGIESINDKIVDKLKRVLGTHAHTTIQKLEKFALEIVKKLEQANKNPQLVNKIRQGDLEVITSLLLLEIDSAEVVYRGGRPELVTLWKLLEDLHGKEFQSMLNPNPGLGSSGGFGLGTSKFGTGASTFGTGASTFGTGASTFGTGASTFGQTQQQQQQQQQQQNSKNFLNEYENCLELFLSVGQDSSHSGSRARSTAYHGAAQGAHLIYTNDELCHAVDVADRLRSLTRNDQQFNKYKWTGSPDKPHRSSSSSSSSSFLSSISGNLTGNSSSMSGSDADLIMGVFLHYADSMSPSKHSKESRFSDKYFAEDVQHARRHLKSVLKQFNQMENSHIDMQNMPCITRTSSVPPHFDIFFATQSIDDYGDNDPDELNMEEWKVKPGRLNVFHTIIIFLVTCIWSQDASVQKVVRDLWYKVFEIQGKDLSNPESVEKTLIDKQLLAPKDGENVDGFYNNNVSTNSFGFVGSGSSSISIGGGYSYGRGL